MAAHLPAQGVDRVIPVELQPEPEDFDDKVRKHGLDWLAAKGIPVSGPLPAGETLPSFWTRALQQLGTAYSQVCSYFAVRIDTVTGDLTTDHFVPKSKAPGRANDWANLRLACLPANRRKRDHDDVLDPVGLRPDTFHINLADGSIRANTGLDSELHEAARKTISRLQLDDAKLRRRRASDYSRHLENGGDSHAQAVLKTMSPLVWHEAARLDLL